MKFRESVPVNLIQNMNKYLPPSKPHKTYGPPSITDQQLPSVHGSGSFHGSDSFGSGTSFTQSFSQAALAAPNVNYGTPLSFNDFNTPAPSLTYGAPNFVPPSSLGSGGNNLYQGIEATLAPTYGGPSYNAPGHDCQQNGGNFQYSGGIGQNYGAPDSSALSDTLSATYLAPNINELDLQRHVEQLGDLKDSYGNPISSNFGAPDQTGAAAVTTDVRAAPAGASNEFSDSASQSQNSLSGGFSAAELTAALTAQGFGTEPKNIVASSEVDATQFLKTSEGGQALALAQTISGDGDGFQIQGSQGTYTLQIQPADGGLGTDGSDAKIPHDRLLANGLLENIIAAIEKQPAGGQILINGVLGQPEQYGSDLAQSASSSVVEQAKSSEEQPKQLRGDTSPQVDDQSASASEDSEVALYFNQQQSDESRSSAAISEDAKPADGAADSKQNEDKST